MTNKQIEKIKTQKWNENTFVLIAMHSYKGTYLIMGNYNIKPDNQFC